MGVAVASDSMLTVKLNDSTAGKTLANSRKIHEIGPGHKVLVLSAGNADINNLPIELYVLRWAAGLAEPLISTRAYAEDFVRWLGDNSTGSNRSEEETIEEKAEELVWDVYFELERLASLQDETLQNRPEPWEFEFSGWYGLEKARANKYNRVAREAVANTLKNLSDKWEYKFFSESVAIKSLSLSEAQKIVEEVFPGKSLPATAKQELVAALPGSLRRYLRPNAEQTILNFVGYGSDSYTPRITELILNGSMPKMVLGWFSVSAEKEPDGIGGATIFYPAQRNAINTFMRGIDPNLRGELAKMLDIALVDGAFAASALEANRWGDTFGQDFQVFKEKSHQSLIRQIDSFSENMNSILVTTVSAMDLTGVAETAEAIAGLQILAAQNDENAPSSGGIIEVATIDLQQGVQWHRRIPRTKSGT
jgi:hypothetical protein